MAGRNDRTAVAGKSSWAKLRFGGSTRCSSAAQPRDLTSVLVIEDDAFVRGAARRILESENYRVHEAATIADARRLLHARQPIHLVLSDVGLPDGLGSVFVADLERTRPEISTQLMSGDPSEYLVRARRIPPGTCVLQKPFSRTELLRAVRRATERRTQRR